MGVRYYGTYKGVPIFRDYNVADDRQVYIGNGQGCDTFWFRSVKEAKKFIDKYRDKLKCDENGREPGLGLIPRELCERCQCHYSAFTEEFKKFKPHVCEELKEKLIREALNG